jgi:hypothetical protein
MDIKTLTNYYQADGKRVLSRTQVINEKNFCDPTRLLRIPPR